MTDVRWLTAWGLGSAAHGGASLLVPLYIVTLGADPFDLGVLAATAALGGVPGALLVGGVADRSGRRRPFVLGALAMTVVVLAVVPLVDSIPVVIVANAILWFAAAAAGPVVSLLVVADAPEGEWGGRYALLNKYQGYGWTGGLVAGAVWTGVVAIVSTPLVAQRTFSGVCGIAAAGALLLGFQWIPPDATTADSRDPRRFVRVLTRTRRLNVRGATFPFAPGRLYWTTRSLDPRTFLDRFTPEMGLLYLAVALFFTGFSAFWAPLPLYLFDSGFGSEAVFGLYVVSSLGAAASFVSVGNLAERHDLSVLLVVGLVIRGLAIPGVVLVGAVLTTSTPTLLATGAVFVVIGVAWALVAVAATTLVTRLSPAPRRGEALGVYAAVSALAGGIGSVLGGGLAGRGYALTFGVAGGFVLFGSAVVAGVRWRRRTSTR